MPPKQRPRFYFVFITLFILAIIVLSSAFSIMVILNNNNSSSSKKKNSIITKKRSMLTSRDKQEESFTDHNNNNNKCFTWTSINGKKSYNSCEVEPIDAVYTWVNGSDELHKIARERFMMKMMMNSNNNKNKNNKMNSTNISSFAEIMVNSTDNSNNENSTTTATSKEQQEINDDRAATNRFADNNELLYSLRSLEQYAGDWVRQVFIVTNGQVPSWLDLDLAANDDDGKKKKIRIITHLELYGAAAGIMNNNIDDDSSSVSSLPSLPSFVHHLPVFSSNSIESHLHRIGDAIESSTSTKIKNKNKKNTHHFSSKFLYLNDDTFFGSDVILDDFYCPTAGHKIFLSWQIPLCNDGCQPGWIGDNYCDVACNNEACEWDGGDCNKATHHPSSNGDSNNNNNQQQFGLFADECAPGCDLNLNWVGDRFCDSKCNVSSCGWDGGDCGLDYFSSKNHQMMMKLDDKREHSCIINVNDVQEISSGRFSSNPSFNRKVTLPSTLLHVGDDDEDENNNGAAILLNISQTFILMSGNNNNNTDENNQTSSSSTTTKLKYAFFDASPLSICDFFIRLFLYSQDSSSFILIFSKKNIRTAVNETMIMSNSSTHNNNNNNLHHQIEECLVTLDYTVTDEETKLNYDAELTLNISFAAVLKHEHARLIREMKEENKNDEKNNNTTTTTITTPTADPENHPPLTEIVQNSNNDNKNRHHEDDSSVEDDNNNNNNQNNNNQDRELLLDTFGESLKYSNRLLNRRFGKQNTPRKAPAHMVHLIERQVISNLWSAMPEEWSKTSASRFRCGDNIQYGFMHMYYLMHAEKKYDRDNDNNNNENDNTSSVSSYSVASSSSSSDNENSKIASEQQQERKFISIDAHPHDVFFDKYLDVDHSGKIEEYELRRLALLLHEKKVSLEAILEKDVSFVGNKKDDDDERYDSNTMMNKTSSSSEITNNDTEENNNNNTTPAVFLEDSYLIDDDAGDPSGYVLLTEEKVIPMNKKYFDAVMTLVKQAFDGIKYDLMRREEARNSENDISSIVNHNNNIITASDFCDSHLAKLITPLFSDPEYPTELQTLDDVTFFMIRDNATVVRHQMDHIIEKRPKFFCINDNMNRTRKSFPRVFNILSEFFETYFPHPSRFEKNNNKQNHHHHSSVEYIWQHPSWLRQHGNNKTFGALARALQYGYSLDEFNQDREKWIREFEQEVNNIVNVPEQQKQEEDDTTTTEEHGDENEIDSPLTNVKLILVTSGFLILLVTVTLVFVKFVV